MYCSLLISVTWIVSQVFLYFHRNIMSNTSSHLCRLCFITSARSSVFYMRTAKAKSDMHTKLGTTHPPGGSIFESQLASWKPLNKHIVYLQTETYRSRALGLDAQLLQLLAWAYLDSHINKKQYLLRSKHNQAFLLAAIYTKKKYGPLSQRVQFLTYKQLVSVYIKKHAKRGAEVSV